MYMPTVKNCVTSTIHVGVIPPANVEEATHSRH